MYFDFVQLEGSATDVCASSPTQLDTFRGTVRLSTETLSTLLLGRVCKKICFFMPTTMEASAHK